MTTAFQIIFDRAESISMSCRPVTAQTMSRGNVVRTVSRGSQVWRFDVKLPDGIPWQQLRQSIQAIENANRYTLGTVQLNDPGLTDWLNPYLGDSANTTGFVGSWTQGSIAFSLLSSPSTPSGYKFRAGDFVQLGSGHVYTVAADVPYTSNTVTVNRPILDASNSASLLVGPAVSWQVYCTDLPLWNIFARDQVSWSSSFTFYEVIV